MIALSHGIFQSEAYPQVSSPHSQYPHRDKMWRKVGSIQGHYCVFSAGVSVKVLEEILPMLATFKTSLCQSGEESRALELKKELKLSHWWGKEMGNRL